MSVESKKRYRVSDYEPQSEDVDENTVKRHLECGEDILKKNETGLSLFERISENVKCKITRSRNMPGDGNCMFWSIFFAYTTEVKDDDEKLTKRLQKFKVSNNCDLHELKRIVQNYDPFKYGAINERQALLLNVIKPFRKQTVDYMRKHKEQFKPFIEDDFEMYLREMGHSRWGDQVAIKAICEILKCKIVVISDRTPFSHGITYDDICLKLYHGSSHYEFAVDPKILRTYYYKQDMNNTLPPLKKIKRDIPELIKDAKQEEFVEAIKSRKNDFIKYRDCDNNTVLHYAVSYRKLEKLELLLNEKSYEDINETNKDIKTAFHIATLLQKEDMMKCLKKAGARGDIKDNSGVTTDELHDLLKVKPLEQSN